jgi:hypothetical protein
MTTLSEVCSCFAVTHHSHIPCDKNVIMIYKKKTAEVLGLKYKFALGSGYVTTNLDKHTQQHFIQMGIHRLNTYHISDVTVTI